MGERNGDGGALAPQGLNERLGVLLAGIAGVVAFECAAEEALQARDGAEDGLSGFSFLLHQRAGCVACCGFHKDL